jgi:anti-sigma B factor antagonist
LHLSRQDIRVARIAEERKVDIPVEKVLDVAVAVVPVIELDASNATEFKADVAGLLDSEMKVVFDLNRVRFADSSGLGALISCLRRVNARGGDLKLCAMSDQVRGLFELVRMHKVFDIHATREEAVRAFQA